jgi:hypothetical protein
VPDWTPQLLLFVFVSHMPFFAWRWRRSGELRHAATALTFALLSLAYALQVFEPDWSWRGSPLYRQARIPALLSAALSIGMLIRHHLARLRRTA